MNISNLGQLTTFQSHNIFYSVSSTCNVVINFCLYITCPLSSYLLLFKIINLYLLVPLLDSMEVLKCIWVNVQKNDVFKWFYELLLDLTLKN
jgi:hypothetical protein